MITDVPLAPPEMEGLSKSTKMFRKFVADLATVFGSCIAASGADNRTYDAMAVIAGLLNAACHAKSLAKLARADREAERDRRGCKCKHRGKCKYSCHCKKKCKCKYWRGMFPSYEFFRMALAGVTEDDAIAAFKCDVERNMRALRRARALRRGMLAVGIDKHAIRRFIGGTGLIFKRINGVVGWHEIYMTAHVLVNGERVTIAAVPLKKGMGDHEAVRLLLAEIKRHAPHLHLVLADKEFCTTQVINEIKAAGLRYLFAHPKNSKAKKEFEALEKKGGGGGATVESVMKSKGTKETAEYWLRIEHSNKFKKGKWKPDDGVSAKYVAYATNFPFIDAARYAERWGIETAYRLDEEVRPKTASRSHGTRVLHFVFAMAVHNIWAVANAVHLHECGGAYRYATLQTIATALRNQARQIAMGLLPPPLDAQPPSGAPRDPGG